MANKTNSVTERTRVITVDITIIEQLKPNDATCNMNKEDIKNYVANEIKTKLDADDVQVIRVKDFIMTKQPG